MILLNTGEPYIVICDNCARGKLVPAEKSYSAEEGNTRGPLMPFGWTTKGARVRCAECNDAMRKALADRRQGFID